MAGCEEYILKLKVSERNDNFNLLCDEFRPKSSYSKEIELHQSFMIVHHESLS